MKWISYMGVAVVAWRGGMVWRGRAAEGRVRNWKGRWRDDDFQPTNLPTKSSVRHRGRGYEPDHSPLDHR